MGHLLNNVVVESVIAGHGHEETESYADGVEDLGCSVHPNLQADGAIHQKMYWFITNLYGYLFEHFFNMLKAFHILWDFLNSAFFVQHYEKKCWGKKVLCVNKNQVQNSTITTTTK